jgi:hypothetical protein
MRSNFERSRITLSDTGLSACMKMADGNPGAISVLAQALRQGGDIDPDAFMGGMGAILAMDTHKIYGPRIWMLYKDVCNQDLRVMLALLRSVQLGFLSDSEFDHAIDNYGEGLDIPVLVAKVEEKLPAFQRASSDMVKE